MKHLIFIISLSLIYILFARCAKEDMDNKGNSEILIDNPIVETRNGLNANRPTFFLTSGTWSNYMQSLPPNRVYRAYNYGLIDSITLVKVSTGNAQIFYTNNLKYNAANFDISIHYKNGVVDTLNNVLSKFTGADQYTFIPDVSKDLIHNTQPTVRYLLWTQRSSHDVVMLPYSGVSNIKKYNWDVHQENGFVLRYIGRHMLMPERPSEFEFTLNNQP
jgi:hypothetical protein